MTARPPAMSAGRMCEAVVAPAISSAAMRRPSPLPLLDKTPIADGSTARTRLVAQMGAGQGNSRDIGRKGRMFDRPAAR